MDYSVQDFVLVLLAGAGSFGGLYWFADELRISLAVGLFCTMSVAILLRMSRQYPDLITRTGMEPWRGPVLPAVLHIAVLSSIISTDLLQTASVFVMIALLWSFGFLMYAYGLGKGLELSGTAGSSSDTGSAVAPSDD